MICLTCREAADDQRPADQHCDSTGGPGAACTCQHRTDRYQACDGAAGADVVTQFTAALQHVTDQTTQVRRRAIVLPAGAPFPPMISFLRGDEEPDGTITIPYITTED